MTPLGVKAFVYKKTYNQLPFKLSGINYAFTKILIDTAKHKRVALKTVLDTEVFCNVKDLTLQSSAMLRPVNW